MPNPEPLPRWISLLAGRRSVAGLERVEALAVRRRMFALMFGFFLVVFWAANLVFAPVALWVIPLLVTVAYVVIVARMTGELRRARTTGI